VKKQTTKSQGKDGKGSEKGKKYEDLR